MKSVFDKDTVRGIKNRINNLKLDSQAQWGKMSVDKMLAHCNVTYEMAYENIHPKPNTIVKFLLKLFVKNSVVNETAFKRNMKTAPAFLISTSKNFETEKKRILKYIDKTLELGEKHFEQKESHSFGRLSLTQWNNMFYKHLDHHLTQFGV